MAKAIKHSYSDYQKTLQVALRDLPMLIVVEGEEPFLRMAAITQLRRAFTQKFPQISELSFYGGGNFNFGELLTELNGDDLFADEKLIILRNVQRELFPERIANEGKNNPLQALADFLAKTQNTHYCIVEVEKINSARIIGKALNKGEIVACPMLSTFNDVQKWLQTQAQIHGKTLDKSAIDLLYTCHGNNLSALNDELEKLSLYLGEEKNITLAITRQFMPDNEEFNFFELLNALEARDRSRAFHFARLINQQGSRDPSGKLLATDVSAHIMVANCARRFEDLVRVRLAIDGEATANEIAQKLKMSPWQAQKLCATAAKFSLRELTKIINVIANELHAAHNTGADIALSLDKIVLAV